MIDSKTFEVFGIVSSIVDASSQRTSSGRPAALPDGYGLGTRSDRRHDGRFLRVEVNFEL